MTSPIKVDEIGGAFSTNVPKKNPYRLWMGKPEGRRPIGEQGHMCVNKSRMEDVEIG
jgi:hypothetical protein